ncbi:MAG TPA: cohesin domain-containing protein [Thermoanaerobaculia bacterium]|jgi:hypothetical protein|nr:cohesin domain-containing protein [Thermoanaerobaculia bacterium]
MSAKRFVPFLVLVSFAAALFGQGAPIVGTAQVRGIVPSTAAVGASVVLRLNVDCTSVQGTTGAGSVPVVLGAYQISVTFDTARLRFESASGGTSSGFTGAPTATNPTTANSTGKVTVTGAQTSSTSPGGDVSVATLTFTALAQGAAAFSSSGVSLSSAFVPPAHGPASVPSTPGNSVVTIAALPGPITNPSPADGASVDESVTLSWTAAANTTSYDVYFGTSSPQFFLSTTSTSVPVSTAPGSEYSWRVVSKSTAGTTSSSTFSFSTRGTAPCAVPKAPVLVAPASATSGASFTISWNAITDASDYRVDEATDPTFATATSTIVTAPRQLSVTKHVSAQTPFYFRVVARNGSTSCDLFGPPSSTKTVVVQAPDVVPTQLHIIPAVISGAGANGSFFRTALQLYNPSAERLAGDLRFHPAGTTGTDSDPTLPFTLEPGQTLYYPDLVVAIGTQGLGSLDMIITEGAPPRAVARVLNDGGEAGTTGMIEPLLAEEDALVAGQSATLIAPPDPVAARYNIGIRTLEATTLTIGLRNSTGSLLQTTTKAYPATWFEQNNASALLGLPPDANDTITFRIESGRAFIYGAATDNRTQDPSVEFARR